MIERSTPVSAFEDSADSVEKAFNYPGQRPEGNFLTDGEEVIELPSDYDRFCHVTDHFLEERGAPLLSERIPLLAYGANASPVRLRDKMRKYPVSEELQKELDAIPIMTVTIPDMMVAWHGKPAQSGAAFAELYQDETTEGEQQASHIAFVSKEQLAIIHASEGVTYRFIEIPVVVEGIGAMSAAAYVAGESVVLQKDGEPVKVASVSHDKATMTAREAVDYMLVNGGGDAQDAADQVRSWKDESLTERKRRQEAIRQKLAAYGVSRTFQHPGALTSGLGRANFHSLPGMKDKGTVSLLEDSFKGGLRPSPTAFQRKIDETRNRHPEWKDQQIERIARTAADPVYATRRRAHDELASFHNLVAQEAKAVAEKESISAAQAEQYVLDYLYKKAAGRNQI